MGKCRSERFPKSADCRKKLQAKIRAVGTVNTDCLKGRNTFADDSRDGYRGHRVVQLGRGALETLAPAPPEGC